MRSSIFVFFFNERTLILMKILILVNIKTCAQQDFFSEFSFFWYLQNKELGIVIIPQNLKMNENLV